MNHSFHANCIRLAFLIGVALALLCGQGAASAQTAKGAKPLAERLTSPQDNSRPLADKLRSPRETLKTFYYAISLYDLFPEMIDDAIACLDLEHLQPRPNNEDATLLALEMEQVLQTFSLPLSSVPDAEAGAAVTIHEADGLKIGMTRGQDGAWRLDSATLAKMPALRRAAQERRKKRPTDLSALRDGFTDPRATMRQFLSAAASGDFTEAARAIDMTSYSNEQRLRDGPVLAQQLAFVMQRCGFMFRQEIPDLPDGPQYTWHADRHGRIALERACLPNGKDSWLFTKQTVRSIPRMYAAAQSVPPAQQYVRLGLLVPALETKGSVTARKRPEDVPPDLGSPRAVLEGFFRTIDAADKDDARLADALVFLDLENINSHDRAAQGAKLALQLEAVLRKVRLDLGTVSDDWNGRHLLLGQGQGVRIEIVRQRDGCWRFSQATVAKIPEMFEKLAGKASSDEGHGSHLDSARDTIITFQTSAGQRDFSRSAQCLDLGAIPASARAELGPVLAFKLKTVLDHLGRIYVQEIPDNPAAPRYVLYRGELGRIALERQTETSKDGPWLFTRDTVERIEPMFRAMFAKAGAEPQKDPVEAVIEPSLWDTPGVWVRQRAPGWMQARVGALELYQWVGLLLAGLASWAGARALMAGVFSHAVAWVLHRSGSALSGRFVRRALRPLTWVACVWLFFGMLTWLDLPVAVAATAFAAHKFILAALVGWLGLRVIDLSMAIYLNSELLKPHRSLSDMIVPVSMRISKTVVLLVIATYMIYQIGEIDLLTRFLTGLGVAGLAASLAAQDALKSFFGTLLLIGERAFKIGDRINVDGKEGIVEQVGFRATRLRTTEGSTLSIPNAVMASAPIDNMGASAPGQTVTKAA